MRRQMHRIAAGLAAIVVASVALVGLTAAPAQADRWEGPYRLKIVPDGAGDRCLATDFSTNVYTFTGCDGPQRWTFQWLDAYPGRSVIRNEATGYCLRLVPFGSGIASAPGCNGADSTYRWYWDDHYIRSEDAYCLTGNPYDGTTFLSYACVFSNKWMVKW